MKTYLLSILLVSMFFAPTSLLAKEKGKGAQKSEVKEKSESSMAIREKYKQQMKNGRQEIKAYTDDYETVPLGTDFEDLEMAEVEDLIALSLI